MKNLISVFKNSSLEEKILWLYIAFIPLTGVAYFLLGTKRVGYVDFIFVALFIVWLVKIFSQKTEFRKTSLEFPLILMLGLFLLSFINSVNFLDSFVEMAGLIYLIILFILIVNIVSTPQRLRHLLAVYLFFSTIVSCGGLFCLGLASKIGDVGDNELLLYTAMESMAHRFPRINFTLETPNMMLSYLHVALIVGAILFLWQKRRKFRLFILLCLITILTAAFFTGSRRFTGLILSLFIILCWFGRGRVISVFKYVTFMGFILFLAASIITSIWVVFPLEVSNEEVTKDIVLKANYAYSLHFIQPIASINMFKKHPVVGVGFGTYNRNFKDNVDWDWWRRSFGFEAYPQYIEPVENKTLSFDPHSVFLGALAETGLVGFFGLMYFFLSYLILLIKRFRDSGNHNLQNVISGCVLAGFIGFLLNGLTLDILSMRHFWIMMAIGITKDI